MGVNTMAYASTTSDTASAPSTAGDTSTSSASTAGVATQSYDEGSAALAPKAAASASRAALEDDLAWFGDAKRLTRRSGAVSAQQILEALSGLDAASVTAVCQAAIGQSEVGFGRFVDALGWTATVGRGLLMPRETVSLVERYPVAVRAVLAAVPERLAELSEVWATSNPAAAAVARSLLPAAVPAGDSAPEVSAAPLTADAQEIVDQSTAATPDAKTVAAASPKLTEFIAALEGRSGSSLRQAIAAETLITKPEDAEALFAALQGLSPEDRDQLRLAYPGLIEHVEDTLPPEARVSAGATFFASGDATSVQDQQVAMLARLDGTALWTNDGAAALEGALRVAVGMGLSADVLARLAALAEDGTLETLFADRERRAAIERGLARSTSADDAQSWLAGLQATPAAPATNGKMGYALGVVVKGLFSSKHREHDGPETVLEDLDLSKVDAFAGSAGAFADVADTNGRKTDDGERINRADVLIGQRGGGYLHITIPQLELNAVRYPYYDLIGETGPIVAAGIDIEATWPTESKPGERAHATFRAASITVSGITVTKPGLALSLNQLQATGFSYEAGEGEVILPKDGAATADVTRLLDQLNPGRLLLTSGLAAMTANLRNPEYLDGQSALIDAFSGTAASGLGGQQVHFDGVTVDGITVGADTFVAQAKTGAVDAVLDSRPSVVGRARMASLEAMIHDASGRLSALPSGDDAAALTARIDAWTEEHDRLAKALPQFEAVEAWYASAGAAVRLASPNAVEPGLAEALLADARAAEVIVPDGASVESLLATVGADLASASGACVSVDGVTATGISAGGVSAADVTTGAMGVRLGEGVAEDVTASATETQAGSGPAVDALGFLAGAGTQGGSLDVSTVSATGVTVSGGSAQVTALTKVKAKLARLEADAAAGPLTAKDKDALAALRASWDKVLPAGHTYGELAGELLAIVGAAGGYDAARQDRTSRAEVDRLEAALASSPITLDALSLDGLSVEAAGSLGADGMRGFGTVESGPISATGLTLGGAHVASVGTSSVSAGVGLDTSEAGEAYAVDAHTGAVSIGAIDAGGVAVAGASAAGGITARGTVDREHIDMMARLDGGGAGAVSTTSRLATATARLEELRANQARTPDLAAELADLEAGLAAYTAALGHIDDLNSRLAELDRRIASTKQAAAEARLIDAVVNPGDPTKEAATQVDAEAAKDAVATLEGQRASLAEGLSAPSAIASDYESHLGLDGGATLDMASVRVTGDGLDALRAGIGSYAVTLDMGQITVPGFDYASSDLHVRGTGPSVFEGATGTASVTLTQPNGGDTQVAVHVTRLVAPGLATTGLILTTGGLEVRLPSASVVDLAVTELDLDLGDPKWAERFTGAVQTGALNAEVSAAVQDSMTMAASTTVHASGLHATALEGGGLTFGLDDLRAIDPKLGASWSDPDGLGGLVQSITRLGGSVRALDNVDISGTYDRSTRRLSTTVGIGDVALDHVHWEDGAHTLDIGSTRVSGASATVRVEPSDDGHSSIWLDAMTIARAEGRQVQYTGSDAVETRYRDGSERTTRNETLVRLPVGSANGIAITHPVQLNADTLDLDLIADSADLTDFLAQQKGNTEGLHSLMVAEASGKCESVHIGWLGDDLTVGAASVSGTAEASGVTGGQAWHAGVRDADATGLSAEVNNLGKFDQSVSADIDALSVPALSFGSDLTLPAGFDLPMTGLGYAHLYGVHATSGLNGTHLHVDSGDGHVMADHELSGRTTGTFDPSRPDPNQQTQDEATLPLYRIAYDLTALDKVNGTLDLNLPSGGPLGVIRFTNGDMRLDLTQNRAALWSSLATQLSTFELGPQKQVKDLIALVQAKYGFDIINLVEPLANGLAYLFKDYSNLGQLVEGWLNGSFQEAAITKADPFSQQGLTELINTVIEDKLVQTALSGGMAYDVLVGNDTRALTTLASYLAEAAGDLTDTVAGGDVTSLDDDAIDARRGMDQERRAEVQDFAARVTSWAGGITMNLSLTSNGGRLDGMQTPVPGLGAAPLADPHVLSAGLDLAVTGAGDLNSGLSAGAVATLRNFTLISGGSRVGIESMTVTAGAREHVTATTAGASASGTFGEVSAGGRAGAVVTFKGFDYDLAATPDAGIDGIATTDDQATGTGSTRPQPGGGTFDGQTAHFIVNQHSASVVEAYNAHFAELEPGP